MELLLFFAAVAAIIGGLIYNFVRTQKRREDWFALAARIGFEYSREDPFGLDRLPFELFDKGDGRGTENVAWGTYRDVPTRAFDFWYYTESTDSKGRRSRSYRRFTCAIAELRGPLPSLCVKPEGLLSRLADHVGFRDIEFESGEFNSAFNVSCHDKRFASYLIDARMMQWLLATKDGWSYEIAGPLLLCYTDQMPQQRVPVLLEALRGFGERVPKVVWDTYGGG